MERRNVMRKKVVIAVLICIVVVGGIWMLKQRSLPSNKALEGPQNASLDVPQNTSYAVLYSTGFRDEAAGKDNRTEVNYFDNNGDFISSDSIGSRTEREAFSWCDAYKKHCLFTLDEIYFSGEESSNITNEEMKITDEDAAYFGEVADSGFVDKINMYYKVVPRGLKYDDTELGAYDFLTLYNDELVKNVKIIEGAKVSVDQTTGLIYAISNEEDRGFEYDVVRPDSNGGEFKVERKKLDMSKFHEKYAKNEDDILTLDKAVIDGNKIYQAISVGEEKSKSYLAEIAISDNGETLQYEEAYPIDINWDESIHADIPVMISDNTIKYYSDVKPNKIITFDIEKKKFTYQPWLEDTVGQEDKEYDVRIIDNTVYVLKVNYGKNAKDNVFSISKANDNGDLEELVSGTLPESKIENDHWRSDFYVINN